MNSILKNVTFVFRLSVIVLKGKASKNLFNRSSLLQILNAHRSICPNLGHVDFGINKVLNENRWA